MAATLSATVAATCTVTEILDNTPFATSAHKQVTHDVLNQSESLTTGGTVPITVVAAFNKALVAGTASIDFTSLTGTNGATVSGSGLKLQVAIIKAKTTNANAITIADGANNGYGGFGSNFEVVLDADQWVMLFGKDKEPDVDATHKTWDLIGTGTQSVDMILVFG